MRLIHVGFNGMNYRIDQGTRAEMHARLKRRVAWLEDQGFDCTRLSPVEVEVNTDGLVNDFCGYLKVTGDDALRLSYGD